MPNIISAMQAMGYNPDPDGVCFGLAAMGAKAAVRKDTSSFVQRIALIHNSSDAFLKTISKEIQIELQSFFDELSIYQGPDNYSAFSAIFPDLRQDIANLELITPDSELVSYALLKEEEKAQVALPKAKVTIVNNFTYHEFTAFVKKTAVFLNGEPFSLLISELTTNHTVQLGFDGTQWLFTDHDKIESCGDTPFNIQWLMLKFFQTKHFTDKKTLSIDLLLSHFSQTDLTKFDNYDFDINTVTPKFDEKILFELVFAIKDFKKITLLKDLIDKIKLLDPTLALFVRTLEFKDSYGQSALFKAAATGQSEMLNLLIEELENTDLSEITKANLLNTKDNENKSSLCCAAVSGHINTVYALLHAMSKIKLPSQMHNMLSSQTIEGSSVIHMATLSGDIKIVELILNAIDGLNICENQKYNLITANTHKQVSVLHLAANKGYADIAELFLSTIKQKKGLEKSKLAWITSSTSSGNNAFYLAAQKGYIAIAKQLFAAIDDCNVDTDSKQRHKKNLISDKDQFGMSAPAITAQQGHVEFYQYILNMYKQLYGDTTHSTLNLLALKKIDGASAMFLAAERGCIRMVNFLIEIIMMLDISDLQKAELIEAKRYDGTPALSLAVQNGHVKIIEDMLKSTSSINLSENEKFRLIEARNRKNASALLLAVNEGDITTVKTLVDFILSSDLTAEAKTILLTSAVPNLNIKSAYQHAVNKSYQQIAKYLKTAMLTSQIFTNEQKIAILQ